MSKIRKIYLPIILLIINTIISFFIPYLLGISNTIIFSSLCYIVGDITYEIVIFFCLSIVEYIFLNYYYKK